MLKRILNFLRLGSSHNPVPAMEPPPPSPQQNLALQAEDDRNHEGNKPHTQIYFTLMAALQQEITARNYEQAQRHALEALDHVPGFVDETLLDGQTFNIQSIPPLEMGGLVFAMLDDRAGIERIERVAASRDQLAHWQDIYTKHKESRTLFRAIEQVVAAKPGVLQNELKHEMGRTDGRRISTLIDWLEKACRIRREPSGKTYALFLSAEPKASTALPKTKLQVVGSHRRGDTVRKQMIDWSVVPHIPLPRSPSDWELNPRDSRENTLAEQFKILDSQEWVALGIEKLPPAERPDPAFRKLYATEKWHPSAGRPRQV